MTLSRNYFYIQCSTLQWHVNFDGLCLSGERCLVIFCWFSPFLHFSLTHLPTESRFTNLCTNMQRISNAKAIPHLCPHAMDYGRPMSVILKPCTERLIELDSTTCVQGDDSLEQGAVESTPACWATFFIAYTGCSDNTHVSIFSHCLQVQTNNSEEMEMLLPASTLPALSKAVYRNYIIGEDQNGQLL